MYIIFLYAYTYIYRYRQIQIGRQKYNVYYICRSQFALQDIFGWWLSQLCPNLGRAESRQFWPQSYLDSRAMWARFLQSTGGHDHIHISMQTFVYTFAVAYALHIHYIYVLHIKYLRFKILFYVNKVLRTYNICPQDLIYIKSDLTDICTYVKKQLLGHM